MGNERLSAANLAKGLTESYPEKMVSAEEAVSRIRNGSRVFIGTGCGEPRSLIDAMVKDPELRDVMIYQMLSFTLAKYVDDPAFHKRFFLKLFFISREIRKAAFEGKIDYIPSYLSQIPELFANGRIGLDVALIQASPPDRFGYCSLGVSVDITRSGMENADLVVAQINPQMPRTGGHSFVHMDDIDFAVFRPEPLVESIPDAKDDEIAERIGMYVSQLIDDGATIQVGFGHLPFQILGHLGGKKDLGIHTQVITDAFLPLFEGKAVTNRRKNYLRGRTVASLCMGSERLYRYVDDNPAFYFRASDFVNDPTVIARNDNLVSISSALEVDLTGQVCTDSMGYLFYSGIGDQVDFIRGSAMSKGGFSIVALPSTARDGQVSRIVSHLSEGAGAAATRGDVNFVVTEYGIAELQGKSIYQRVMELAQIAHPKFRGRLVEEAKKHRYIFADQLPPVEDDLLFTEKYKDSKRLLNGKTVHFAPLFPSDEFEYRNFFYSLKEKTVYSRFFHRIRLFTHDAAQKQWAQIDYRKSLAIIGKVRKRGGNEIVAIGSYASGDGGRADVAFVVREDFQNLGVASRLLEILEKAAGENGYKGFSASVLSENKAMQKVLLNRYPDADVEEGVEDEMIVLADFDKGGGESGVRGQVFLGEDLLGWKDMVRRGAGRLGVLLDDRQTDLLAAHASLLSVWNRKVNLTAVTDPEEMAIKHYVDSLAAAPFIPSGARLLDIGSGGGFPGMPLKIARPSLEVLLIEASRKKASFLSHAVRTLGLGGIEARHVRAERMAQESGFPGAFDVVACRALSNLGRFVELAAPLAAPGATLLAYKALVDEIEMEKAAGALEERRPGTRWEIESRNFVLPFSDRNRTLVFFREVRGETPRPRNK